MTHGEAETRIQELETELLNRTDALTKEVREHGHSQIFSIVFVFLTVVCAMGWIFSAAPTQKHIETENGDWLAVQGAMNKRAEALGWDNYFHRCYPGYTVTSNGNPLFNCYLHVDNFVYKFDCGDGVCVYEEALPSKSRSPDEAAETIRLRLQK